MMEYQKSERSKHNRPFGAERDAAKERTEPSALPYSRETPFDPLELLKKVFHACMPLFPQGVHDAYLYGSYARGDFDEQSDVDILLTVDAQELGDYHHSLVEATDGLLWEYDVLISVVVVPLWRFRQYASDLPFYRNVLHEGIHYAQ